MGVRQTFFFEKKLPKWPTQKKLVFLQKFQRLGLGVVGLIDAKGIGCGSTYMVVRLSDISSNTGVFRLFFRTTGLHILKDIRDIRH